MVKFTISSITRSVKNKEKQSNGVVADLAARLGPTVSLNSFWHLVLLRIGGIFDQIVTPSLPTYSLESSGSSFKRKRVGWEHVGTIRKSGRKERLGALNWTRGKVIDFCWPTHVVGGQR